MLLSSRQNDITTNICQGSPRRKRPRLDVSDGKIFMFSPLFCLLVIDYRKLGQVITEADKGQYRNIYKIRKNIFKS